MQRRGLSALVRGRRFSTRNLGLAQAVTAFHYLTATDFGAFLRGVGEEKARIDGVRVLLLTEDLALPRKNLGPTNGAFLRTEIIEQRLGSVEAFGEPVVNAGEQEWASSETSSAYRAAQVMAWESEHRQHLKFPLELDFQCHQPSDQNNRKELTHQPFQHCQRTGKRTYGEDVPESQRREGCEAEVTELRQGSAAMLRSDAEGSRV